MGRSSHLRTFHPIGCLAFAMLTHKNHHLYTDNWKLSTRGLPGVFLGHGYFMGMKCYIIYIIELDKVVATDTVIFRHVIYPMRPYGNTRVDDLDFTINANPPSGRDLRMYTPEGELCVLVADGCRDFIGYEAQLLTTVELLLEFWDLPVSVTHGPPATLVYQEEIDSRIDPAHLSDQDNWTLHHQNSTETVNGTFSEVSSIDYVRQHSVSDPDTCQIISNSSVILPDPIQVPPSMISSEVEHVEHSLPTVPETHDARMFPQSSVQEATTVSDETFMSQAFTEFDDISSIPISPITSKENSMHPEFSAFFTSEPTGVDPPVFETSPPKVIPFSNDLVPFLDYPLGIFGADDSVLYSLTTGERTMVPEHAINQHLRSMDPTQKALHGLTLNASDFHALYSNTDFQLKEPVVFRSKVMKLSNGWYHHNHRGELVNTTALLTGVMGKHWKRMPIKRANPDDPVTWQQCMNSANRQEWLEAALTEKLNLLSHKTYEVVTPPPGAEILKSKLICTVKRNTSNEITKFKVRLVVQGYQQREGENFFNTFAPTVSATAVRIILALAAHFGYQLFAMDVTAAFLHALIDHPHIYVRPPKGMEEHDGKVWHLDKALYGLKQSPALFSKELGTKLKAFGFKPDPNESHVWRYIRPETCDEIFLVHHVDDILLAASSTQVYEDFVKFMEETAGYSFGSKGLVNEYLKMQIFQDIQLGIVEIRQTGYIESLLREHQWDARITMREPLSLTHAKDFWKDSPALNTTKHATYRSLIGGLLWLSVWTRPDIAFTVNLLSRVLQHPTEHHLTMAYHVLGYLNRTKQFGIRYSRAKSIIEDEEFDIPMLFGYADASHLDCKLTCRSTSGHIMMLAGGAVSWRSKRNPIVTLSTAESEFVSASKCGQETCFLRMMLEHLGCPQRKPTIIFEDNEACLLMSQDPIHAQRTKHINLRVHHIKELDKREICRLMKVSSQNQHADYLTKPLTIQFLERHHLFTCGYAELISTVWTNMPTED